MYYLALLMLSLALTYLIRYYAIKKSIMDIPNERSSHSIPTPRGGGLAIVITFFIGLIFFRDTIETNLFYAFFSSLPIIVISLVDDIISVSSKVRFIVQMLSALLALYLLGGVDSVDFHFFTLSGIWLNALALIATVWLTNLYNFLDGIDGYAASQAMAVAVGLTLFFNASLGLLLMVSVLGFLVFNWHKASIFMGDVGSATLGFIFAVMVFSDASEGNIFFWLVILSLFWYDATITLIRRYKNGEKITQAHKKHAYQRLTQFGWSHSKVVFFSIVINAILLGMLYALEKEYWGYLFVATVVVMYRMMHYIDKKKSFYA